MATQYGEDIAVLKDQMKDVKDALTRIETKLDSGAATYATKQELRSFKWITVPLVILLTAVLTGLVIYYLSGRQSVTDPSANNPTTSSTTTVNTPGGSTSTTSTKDGTPSTTSSATAHSDAAQPADSQTSNGGVNLTLPKVP